MEIIKDITKIHLTDTAVTVGKFDGLHKGHQKLFSLICAQKQKGLHPVAVTFNRSPKTIVEGGLFQYILTEEEKYRYYAMTGIEYLVECEVNKQFMNMEAEEFIHKILIAKLGVRYLCAGTDFRFGKNRTGDIAMLKEAGKENGFEVEVVDKEKYQAEEISSTLVKEKIKEGKMEEAEALLGYPFTFVGEIVHGNQLGRTVGMPTINLIPARDKILPPFGVYAALVSIDGVSYQGITNVGCKPTVSDEQLVTVETFLFDFSEDVYGKTASVQLKHYVRPERKFETLEKVKSQVEKDIALCKKIFT